jgi:quercetin dioxygenase-like cupin family protein
MTQKLLMMMLGLGVCAADEIATITLGPDPKVEIDNAWVRVLRVKLPPHASIAMQQHPGIVTVFLTDAHQKITGVFDGKVRNLDLKAGDVGFREAAGKEVEENLSDRPIEAVMIELKPGAPKSPPVSLDPVKLDPEHHPVVFENDRVRVLHTLLPPHVKSPMHEHPHYVVVYLTELHTTMKMGDGRLVDNPRKAGDIGWRDPLQHQTEQMGDTPAAEIQVELK